MNNPLPTILSGLATLLAVFALIFSFGSHTAPTVSGVINYDEVDATALKIGGTNGSRVGPIITSTCSLIASNYSVTATTSVAMDCAVTGVVPGDLVFVKTGTTTPSFGPGWEIPQASASSTSGYATVTVYNGTGATGIIPASIASSTTFLILHPLSTVPGL